MYKYIRHPMYVGSILMILGAYLINPILGVIFISYCVFANRATIEEQIMCQDKKYEEYMKKTGRFLPKIRINYGTLG
jgi:protein-S-isoprenylcysteine O-methyltransferase Ste14